MEHACLFLIGCGHQFLFKDLFTEIPFIQFLPEYNLIQFLDMPQREEFG